MKRFSQIITAATFSLLATATAAFSAPTLKQHVIVNTKIVTVGDMFNDAGALAEKGLFMSPKPGTTGNVPLASIALAAERAGLSSFDDAGLSAVRVERAGLAINRDFLNNLMADELRNRDMLKPEHMVEFNNFGGFQTVHAATNQHMPVEVVDFYFNRQSNRVQAKLSVAGQTKPLTLDGTIDILAPAAHLRRTMTKGEIVDINDIEFRPTPIRFGQTNGELDVTNILGKSLTRTVRENTMLRPSDLSEPIIIGRNDVVTILYRQGPLKLTVKGQALHAASKDQTVTVMNLMSKKMVQGIATGTGTVVITNDPTRLASR